MPALATLLIRAIAHALLHEHPDAGLWSAVAKLEAADAARNKAIDADDANPQDPAIRAIIRGALAERRAAMAVISGLPAQTIDGCAIKAYILNDDVVNGSTDFTRAIACGLVADLVRLALRT